jgi:hypothetical protein
VGVFNTNWSQNYSWNSAAATITVNSSLSFNATATATPTAIVRGGSSAISLKVTDTGTGGLTNANVELQIFNSSGQAVATNVWSGQNFTGGQALSYSYTWKTSTSLPTGTYTVEIGVFDSGWTTNYYWNSSAASIAVTAGQAPAAPTGLAASAGTRRVSLSWKASSGAASYSIYRGTSAGGEGATPVKTGVTGTSYTDTGLTSGTTYFYKVAAVNSSGTSALSNETSAKAR